MTIETTTRRKTVERCYTEIGDTEIRTAILLDFLEAVENTGPYDPVKWRHDFEKAADPLVEVGIVGETTSGSWYEGDADGVRHLMEDVRGDWYEYIDGHKT